MNSISAQQCRAARAWLDWSQDILAEKSGVSRRAIAEFERGLSVPHDRTLRELEAAFANAGVQFIFDGARGTGIKVGQPTEVT